MADKRFVAKNGLDNSSQTITNVADPVNAQDAATRAFASNATNLSSGTLALARGGTGAGTQAGAANAILPSQTSQSGKYLTTDGTNVSWGTVSTGTSVTVADDTTTNATRYVVFEDVTSGTSSSINVASTKLTFNPSTGVLTASGGFSGNITGTAANVTGTVAIANGGTGATTAPTARTALGATTVGGNLFTLANPNGITFVQVNADNTVSALSASTFRSAIGAAASAHTHAASEIASGTLAVDRGGTGIASYTVGNYIYASGATTLTQRTPTQVRSDIRAEFEQTSGVPRMNLGDPTAREMALFDGQYDNKVERFPLANLWCETSTNGVTWTDASPTQNQKERLVGGDANNSSLSIPHGTAYYRVRFRANTYVYLNAIYAYMSTQGNSTQVQVFRKHDNDANWTAVANSTTTVSSWPGHMYLPHGTIPFNPTATQGTHNHEVYVVFIPTWSHATNPILLYKLQWWGGYPAARRNVYSTDEFGNVVFPAALTATTITGALSGNASTATTLATARTLWGSSFNGSADLTGALWLQDGGVNQGRLGATSWHDATYLNTSLYYAGSGDSHAAANWRYIRAAGVNNVAGGLLIMKGNGTETGVQLSLFTAPTSTGAAATPASLNLRWRVDGTGAMTVGTSADIGNVSGITSATMRVGGDIRSSGTIYATDFVLTGGAGSGVGITLNDLSDVVISSASTNQVLQYNGTNWVNATISTGGASVTISDDTSTNANRYVVFEDVTSGTSSTMQVSSTKLTFNPSTGTLNATVFSGSGASLTSLNAGNVSSGTLALARGGTGASTQAGAANAVLPSQTSQSGKYLTTDGTNVSWATVSGGGTTTNAVTFNNGGSGSASGTTFNGSAAVTVSHNTIGSPARASFPANNESTLDAADIRTLTNPTTGLGYAAGMRVRFSSLNDDNASPYADVIDLSTYTDSSGGGFNALYFGKNSQLIQHKYAAAAGTSWTTKTVAYTDSNITGSAATLTTARTLWGQSFNGSANVTGNLTSVGNITGAGAVTLTATGSTLALAATGASAVQFYTNGSLRAQFLSTGDLQADVWTKIYSPSGNAGVLNLRDGAGTVDAREWSFRISGGALDLRAVADSNTTQTTVISFARAGGVTVGTGSVTVQAAATQDAVRLQGRAGGTGSFAVTITPTTLSANRTLTLANGDTTLVTGTMLPTAGGTITGTLNIQAAATQDAIRLLGRAGGTGSFVVTVTPTTLTASRTLTLANGDTTLVAGTMVPTSTSITINGTTNQITSSAGAQDLSANRTWTLSLPQNIHTGATPTFAAVILGTDPGGSNLVRAASARITSLGVGRDSSGTAGRIDASNDVVAYSSSDLRLKTNIVPLTGALALVDTLSAIRFQWRQDPELKVHHGYDDAPDIGLVAQEVEAVFPELVQERESGFKAVRYERMIPVLLQAIKELHQEVQVLRQERT